MTAPLLTITAYGLPAPQGSKRHIGRGVMIESSKRVKPWRDDVKNAAERFIESQRVRGLHWTPLDEPLAVSMVFTLPKPASAPKQRRTWPMRLPDLSKLIRSTEDALTDAGIWRDDARVVECTARKVYPGEDESALASPGVVVRIRSLAVDLETTPTRPHRDEPALDRRLHPRTNPAA
ncbi:RusA family crossover junction endodeoxyribonuclease [Micromonospora sp. WMMA1363]|uniref:RusA family crossover junction endodeoxyribonuclease n=1 Tax=Micromonospora sp. WMMA1363 TaxID=3053985 RepID=UPI00259D0AC6|nr:RusA family crossover junction endodeoxyribonuclease [Micromonospora sp. WMMA1363]MDM4721139.1 RusA family crossover junction endodeoxyribonuclease [Micromonospora sp. WMMA1363]